MDFTIKTYKNLLTTLQKQGFSFLTFAEYMNKLNASSHTPDGQKHSHSPLTSHHSSLTTHFSPLIILRHDVDALPQNSLRFARIQAEMGIKGTYYFRAVPQSWDEAIINEIHELGHEVGYHYENMDVASKKLKHTAHLSPLTSHRLIDLAYEDFLENLEKLKKIVPVSTICMHGSPLSKFDNRDIWKKYDYKKLGLLAEPYFDIDFNHLFYLTDTGRRWDGHRFNVRDKATKENPVTNPQFLRLQFHSTTDLINAINNQKNTEQRTPVKSAPPVAFHGLPSEIRSKFLQGVNKEQRTKNKEQSFPSHAMLNFHPQRWHSKPLPWLKELVWQNTKNQVKRMLIAARRNK